MSDSVTNPDIPLSGATSLIHSGAERSQFGETSEALYLTQGFVYESAEAAEARFAGDEPGYVYSRYANPTVRIFEQRMSALEGAEDSRAVASGMAAVTSAIQACVKAGDHIVAASALFGSCRFIVEEFMPRFGVDSTLVTGTDLAAWEAAIRPNTKVLFLESPTNPALDVIDIKAVAELAKRIGARLIVDNVFATPIYQKPLTLGADIVTYSATKHIDGQGRCLGGIVLGTTAFIEDELAPLLKHTGPSLSPFNAWILLKGLETLPLRVRQQTLSANAIADFLAQSSKVSRVLYPGRSDHPQYEIAQRQMSAASTLVAFDLGSKEAAFAFANALKIIKISNNLGDAKSLITHPSTTTHQRLPDEEKAALGISDGLLRLSVGLEETDDLIADIKNALCA